MTIHISDRAVRVFTTALVLITCLAILNLYRASAATVTIRGATAASAAGVPAVINYQGQVRVDGSPFTGAGAFKFAIVSPDGAQSYWSNDNTSTAGSEPTQAVNLNVTNGLFSIMLGDTSLAGMSQPLDATVFREGDCYLRVWFSSGGAFTRIDDQRITASPYAMVAQVADSADSAANADTVDGMHASELIVQNGGLPSGTIILGAAQDASLLDAGFEIIGKATDTCVNCPRFPGSWLRTSLNGAPSPRVGFGMRKMGNFIAIWGGYNDTQNLNDGAIYDPDRDTWIPVSTEGAPSARRDNSFTTPTYSDPTFTVWGGFDGTNYLDDGATYNYATGAWTPLPEEGRPSARAGHTGAETTYGLFVFGGHDGSGYLSDAALLDHGVTWLTMPSFPLQPRGQYSETVYQTQVTVWGGTDGSQYFNDGARFDTDNDFQTWATLPVVPGGFAGRVGHSMSVTTTNDRTLLIWGGYDGTHYLRDGLILRDSTWTSIPPPPAGFAGRAYHSAVITDMGLFIWGGYDGSQYLSDGAYYDLALGTWTLLEAPAGVEPRAYHAMVAYPTVNGFLIFGGRGGFGPAGLLSEPWSFNRNLYYYRLP